MAAAIGAATVASVVFAEDAALPSGLPLALMAVGGVVGALAWGARALPISRRTQLVGGLGLYAALMLATVIAPERDHVGVARAAAPRRRHATHSRRSCAATSRLPSAARRASRG